MGKEGSRRNYDGEFKREAVQLVTDRGQSVKKVAENLGIHPNVLSRWKREYLKDGKDAFPGKGHLRPEEEELMRLRREKADLIEERDILKKALGIFSRKKR